VLNSLNEEEHIVVAPAGNQGCTTPQYPAAFPEVVGVGSRDRYGRTSTFSNHGPWVDCYAEGEDVVSTFIDNWPYGKTEESEPAGSARAGAFLDKTFRSGWASWSGTSFAAPEIAAELALGTARGVTPRQAWDDLQRTLATRSPDLRYRRRNLWSRIRRRM
jgi:subtilisin family serine protease